jgi:hypothetical protein
LLAKEQLGGNRTLSTQSVATKHGRWTCRLLIKWEIPSLRNPTSEKIIGIGLLDIQKKKWVRNPMASYYLILKE